MKPTKLILPLLFAVCSPAFSQESASQPAVATLELASFATLDANGAAVTASQPGEGTIVRGVAVATERPEQIAQPVQMGYVSGSGTLSFRSVRKGPVAYLGISTGQISPELAAQMPLPPDTGLLVNFVEAGSVAEKAGLQKNDVLAKLDDQILIDPRQFSILVANHKEGERVKISLIRRGQASEITATLGQRVEGGVEQGGCGITTLSEPGIMIDGTLQRPLQTFTRRLEVAPGSGEAGKPMELSLGTLGSSGTLRIVPQAAEEAMDQKSLQEKIENLSRRLDELSRQLKERK